MSGMPFCERLPPHHRRFSMPEGFIRPDSRPVVQDTTAAAAWEVAYTLAAQDDACVCRATCSD